MWKNNESSNQRTHIDQYKIFSSHLGEVSTAYLRIRKNNNIGKKVIIYDNNTFFTISTIHDKQGKYNKIIINNKNQTLNEIEL